MNINIAKNSPLNPSMHEGSRRRIERSKQENYPTGGERLHVKQPKTIAEILRHGK